MSEFIGLHYRPETQILCLSRGINSGLFPKLFLESWATYLFIDVSQKLVQNIKLLPDLAYSRAVFWLMIEMSNIFFDCVKVLPEFKVSKMPVRFIKFNTWPGYKMQLFLSQPLMSLRNIPLYASSAFIVMLLPSFPIVSCLIF